MLDGDDIVYVARVPTTRIMTVAINVGTRFPAYATSMGRVLLAGLPDEAIEEYLDRVPLDAAHRPHRRRAGRSARPSWPGYAARATPLVDQELEVGLRSVAAPVRDRTGQVVAAMNVSAHASRTSLETIRKDLVPPLLVAAAGIEADLKIAGR